jgi:hypothetical protein
MQMYHDELDMESPDWVTATACQAFSLAGRVENTEWLVKNQTTVRPSDTLQLKLAPSGGTAVVFSTAK